MPAATTSPTGAPLPAWPELTLLSAVWGASFFSIEIAQRELGPVTVVLFRVAPAAALLWLIAAARGLSVPRNPRVWLGFLVMGILNNALPFTLMSWGQTRIDTGLVAILNATTALFAVAVAAAVFPDERLTRRRVAGTLIGFAGVVAAIGPGSLGALEAASLAQYAVLGGALSYAFASAWAKARLGALPPVVAAAGMLTGSTALMIPLTLVLEGAPPLALSAPTWAAVAWYSGLGTAGAYLLYYRILGVAGAGTLMLCTLMIPPIAIALGAAFLGEALAPRTHLGFALIALGLVTIDGRLLARIRSRRAPQA